MAIKDFTLTVERLKEVLHYDYETGQFTRLISAGGALAGSRPGAIDSRGYLQIKIDRRLYLAHRLAWFYITGHWHSLCIDHVDGDKLNNRLENLRPITKSWNSQNRHVASRDSRTGVLGVSHRRGGYVAQIQAGPSMKYLGTFATPELAHAAYLVAKRALHPGSTI